MSTGRGETPPLPAAIVRGLTLWEQGRHFEAHEAMEEAWLDERGPLRRFWQGLIQGVVACHHLERANRGGARKMLDAAIAKLESFVPGESGSREARAPLDVEPLVEAMRAARRSIKNDECPRPFAAPRRPAD